MNRKSVITGLLLLLLGVASQGIAAGTWEFALSLPGKGAEHSLGEALALAMDESRQRYYVVDSSHGQLVSFDQQGQFLNALNPGNALKKPVAMALASAGKFWVIERSNNQLVYVDLDRQQVRAFSLFAPDGLPIFPEKVKVDRKNRLYLLDRSRGTVVRLDDNLKVKQTFLGEKGFRGFTDFLLTEEGLWALDALRRELTLFDDNGKRLRKVELVDKLSFPVAFETDSAGQFYLLDRHAAKILVFNRSGEFSYEFLIKGKRQGQLWYPAGLKFDWAGRLCVVNEGNGRIDIYSR